MVPAVQAPRALDRPLRVSHLSPTFFSPESVLGGGERFAEELARAMSTRAQVRFISFGQRAARAQVSPTFERVILKSWTRSLMTPFAPALWRALRGSQVIHCHQYYTLPTFLACLVGRAQGSRVFVSDLGGGAWTPGYQIDQSRWISMHLPISRYAARGLPGRNQRHAVIYGGVDLERYRMRPDLEHDGSVVFLGRVLPHKGIHFLIEGLPAGVPLHVIGAAGDPEYLGRLRGLAAGKDVRFHGALTDEQVLEILGRAMVLVHPTPVDAAGSAGVNELFGLALVEAMARGCPVLASRVASLPEIVEDGVSGFLIAANDPAAIAMGIGKLSEAPNDWRRMALAARARVEQCFTWSAVVDRCLEAYGQVS
jgi:glycosyltransferase involved in cell wall biosynthesis